MTNQPLVTKAVLLAAGKGTRMRELTAELPKPMIAVRGKPILEHIVGGLAAAGVQRILIVVGYRADVVQDHFGNGERFGVQVEYATQVVQDGTGRVVELARDFAGADPFVLSYGDILIRPENYQRLVQLDDAEALVSVKYNPGEIAKGGAVFVNERFELVDLREKPKPGEPTSPWYNAGVYTFRPSIFDFTARLEKSERGEYELTDAIRALALSGKKVQALELAGEWADVRDPEILAELNAGENSAPGGRGWNFSRLPPRHACFPDPPGTGLSLPGRARNRCRNRCACREIAEGRQRRKRDHFGRATRRKTAAEGRRTGNSLPPAVARVVQQRNSRSHVLHVERHRFDPTENDLDALIGALAAKAMVDPSGHCKIGNQKAVEFLVAELVRQRQAETQLTFAVSMLGAKAVPYLVDVYRTNDSWDTELDRALLSVFHDMGSKGLGLPSTALEVAVDENVDPERRVLRD